MEAVTPTENIIMKRKRKRREYPKPKGHDTKYQELKVVDEAEEDSNLPQRTFSFSEQNANLTAINPPSMNSRFAYFNGATLCQLTQLHFLLITHFPPIPLFLSLSPHNFQRLISGSSPQYPLFHSFSSLSPSSSAIDGGRS